MSNLGHILKYFLLRSGSELSLAEQIAFSPFLVQLVVTRRCNLKCSYCNEYDLTSEPVPAEILIERIKKIRGLGALSIEFTGGEPLLHPGLFDLVSLATDLNFPARMLISNAVLMKDDAILALNDAGLTHLQVSIDGVNSNEVTKKSINNLGARLLRIAKLAKFKVVISGVLGACPPQETLEVLDFAKNCGFIPRILLIHDNVGQLKISKQELSTYWEAKRRIGKRFFESHGYREKLISGEPAPFKCRGGGRYIYVDEFGLAHWCSQKAGLFAKPILEYTIEDLQTQFYNRKGGCEPMCTIGCVRTCSARDEFRRQG